MFDLEARKNKCLKLIENYYKGVSLRDAVLDQEISKYIDGRRVLDAGCGSNMEVLAKHAYKTSFAVGLDLEFPDNSKAPNCHGIVGNLEAIPFRDDSFDLIFSRSVCEHLRNPIKVFQEMKRVLRKNGTLLIATPNKYDYASLIAAITPHHVHNYVVKGIFGANGYDTFPTYYRINTVKAFKQVASEVQLQLISIKRVRHYPYYLMFSPLLFRLGIFYDVVISTLNLDFLQPTLIAVLKKLDQ